jgi:predicted lipoprotein with Yx(FWY)xxD motif
MSFRRGYLALLAVPVLAIGLAACGGSSSNSSSGSSNAANATSVSTSSDTVSTKSVSGTGTVLVDSTGMTLYTNDQDTASKIACTGQCQSFWIPVKAPSGGQPTSSESAVQSKLGVEQGIVTFDGKPLYTFVQDTSPGQVTGNGFQDSFGGTTFTWAAATTSGGAASSTSTSTSSSSNGPTGSYGGGSGGSSSSSGSSGGYSY